MVTQTKGRQMSRKDYRLIANSLRRLGEKTHNWQAVALTANALATTFAVDNFRFDRLKFLDECGVWNEGSGV